MVPTLGSALIRSPMYMPWSLEPKSITTWSLFAEHIQDAISNLENIRNHPDVSLCSIMALIYAHKCCETIGECSYARLGLVPPGKDGPTPNTLPFKGCRQRCVPW